METEVILLDNGRCRKAIVSGNCTTIEQWLCPCTIGHSYEFEAERCATIQYRLNDPKLKAQQKCYGCKHYDNDLEPTKFTNHTKNPTEVSHGVLFREFCRCEELQSEADNYNEEYAELSGAESICSDEDYSYFTKLTEG